MLRVMNPDKEPCRLLRNNLFGSVCVFFSLLCGSKLIRFFFYNAVILSVGIPFFFSVAIFPSPIIVMRNNLKPFFLRRIIFRIVYSQMWILRVL